MTTTGQKVFNALLLYATKFDLIINLKPAKSLGLTEPPACLAGGEMIECMEECPWHFSEAQ